MKEDKEGRRVIAEHENLPTYSAAEGPRQLLRGARERFSDVHCPRATQSATRHQQKQAEAAWRPA